MTPGRGQFHTHVQGLVRVCADCLSIPGGCRDPGRYEVTHPGFHPDPHGCDEKGQDNQIRRISAPNDCTYDHEHRHHPDEYHQCIVPRRAFEGLLPHGSKPIYPTCQARTCLGTRQGLHIAAGRRDRPSVRNGDSPIRIGDRDNTSRGHQVHLAFPPRIGLVHLPILQNDGRRIVGVGLTTQRNEQPSAALVVGSGQADRLFRTAGPRFHLRHSPDPCLGRHAQSEELAGCVLDFVPHGCH